MATAAPPRAPRGTPQNGKLGVTPTSAEMLIVSVDAIKVADNVRADLGDLEEMRQSIEQVGILQPIGLRRQGDGYLLVYGHRRLAAAKLAGLPGIPAIIVDGKQSQAERTVTQLVENVQRRDLNALEEAKALRGILDASKGMTQEQLADQVGRSRPTVTNLLRILELDPTPVFRWGWPGQRNGRSHLRQKWHAIPECTGWQDQKARCGVRLAVLVALFPELPPWVKPGEKCGNCRDLTWNVAPSNVGGDA